MFYELSNYTHDVLSCHGEGINGGEIDDFKHSHIERNGQNQREGVFLSQF